MASTPKVLIVEDDSFLMDAYKVKLGQQGWAIVTASDGEQAEAAAKKHKPQLVILDLVIPKKTGLEVLKSIKSNDDTKDAAVLVASNLDQKSTVDEAMQLGAADYFIKSNISIDDLVAKCKELL